MKGVPCLLHPTIVTPPSPPPPPSPGLRLSRTQRQKCGGNQDPTEHAPFSERDVRPRCNRNGGRGKRLSSGSFDWLLFWLVVEKPLLNRFLFLLLQLCCHGLFPNCSALKTMRVRTVATELTLGLMEGRVRSFVVSEMANMTAWPDF